MSARIKQKFIIKAVLKNDSAFSISKGEGEFIDSLVIKDSNEKPYIPATSLMGVIKSEFLKYFGKKANAFLGDDNNFSSFAISDAVLLDEANLSIRNDIKVSAQTGITQDGALYDYEVVTKGAKFSFKAEATLRVMHDENEFLKCLDAFCSILKDGFYLGSKTMSGLGKVKFEDIKISKFDFENDESAFKNYIDKKPLNNYEFNYIKKEQNDINFRLILDIKNSLLIGSTMTQTDADIANLKENDEFLASGTSLKGAIRNRALKIAKTFGKESLIDDIFGFVLENEKSKNEKAQKSRIKIDEVVLKNVFSKLHQRTKIDRFSGSTIDGALFDSEALFSGDLVLNLSLSDPKNSEIGLILLVLKDIATANLAVGAGKNIGRGVLEINQNSTLDENASFNAYNGGFKIYYKEKLSTENLNEFVKKFREY